MQWKSVTVVHWSTEGCLTYNFLPVISRSKCRLDVLVEVLNILCVTITVLIASIANFFCQCQYNDPLEGYIIIIIKYYLILSLWVVESVMSRDLLHNYNNKRSLLKNKCWQTVQSGLKSPINWTTCILTVY
jgi:cytochrome c biogenesis protein CcdA